MELKMTTMLHRNLRQFAAISAGILLLSTGGNCFAQAVEPAPSDIGRIYNTLLQDGLNIISPSRPDIRSGREAVQMLPPGASRAQPHAGFGRRNAGPQQVATPPVPDSPTTYFRAQLSDQIDFLAKQGNDVQQLRGMVERLLRTLGRAQQLITEFRF
jgi:hypothetical protein